MSNLTHQRTRSWLFTPATRPDRFAKANAVGADVAILDLGAAIHPAQIGVINTALTPDAAAVQKARAILAENAKGVGTVDGQMIDEAVARKARRILAMAGIKA